MCRAAVAILALIALGRPVIAYSDFAERHFGRSSPASQHVGDETFGDEFKRPKR